MYNAVDISQYSDYNSIISALSSFRSGIAEVGDGAAPNAPIRNILPSFPITGYYLSIYCNITKYDGLYFGAGILHFYLFNPVVFGLNVYELYVVVNASDYKILTTSWQLITNNTDRITAIESYNSSGVTALATAHADGNKTFSTLLQELWPTISSYGNTQRMNLCIKYDNNYFNAVAQNDFLYSVISATYASYFAMMFRVGNNTGKAYLYNPANSTPYADISNEKPPANADLMLVFRH